MIVGELLIKRYYVHGSLGKIFVVMKRLELFCISIWFKI